jgi:hypothetical protein
LADRRLEIRDRTAGFAAVVLSLLQQQSQLRHLFVESALHLPNLILQDGHIALQFDDFLACSETEAREDAQKKSEPDKFHAGFLN